MSDPRKLAEKRTTKALQALGMVAKLAPYEQLSKDDLDKISGRLHLEIARIDDAFESRSATAEPGFILDSED